MKIEIDKYLKEIRPIAMAVTAIISGVGGFLLNDWLGFRADHRELFRIEYTEARNAHRDLVDEMRMFADQATGRGQVTPEERDRFRKKATFLYQTMRGVLARAPEIEEEFARYERAIIKVQSAALSFSGPQDARAFVEAYAEFLEAYDNLNNRIARTRNSYIRQLI